MNWSYENIAYGYDENQKLDIIIPNNESAHAIVYIHGGAYLIGNKIEYPSFLADYTKNNIFATVNYRLINENNTIQMKDILSDLKTVLVKIIELSKINGVNVKDFILAGHSAGGHIGLLYGYKYQDEKIRIATCISLAGPTDFTDDSGWSSMPMWGEDTETRLSFLSKVGSRLAGHQIELKQLYWTKQKDYFLFKP
ncbi:MAG: alpha/beta hydrolase [Treponema sp.]|nr:alpha/beta hydrolase [Treponema sp.]